MHTKSFLALPAVLLGAVVNAQETMDMSTSTWSTFTVGALPSATWAYFNTTVTSVVVVQELTTICTSSTTLTFNGCEYPVTPKQTLVVTNCPCTLIKAVPTVTSTICPIGPTGAVGTAPVAPPVNPVNPVWTAPTAPPAAQPKPVTVSGAAGSQSTLGLVAGLAAVAIGMVAL